MNTECLPPRRPCRGAATYRVRVAGVLDASWSERTGGMMIVVHPVAGAGGTTDLVGPLPDQAALMGILDRLYTHGAQLLSVECLGSVEAARDPAELIGAKEGR